MVHMSIKTALVVLIAVNRAHIDRWLYMPKQGNICFGFFVACSLEGGEGHEMIEGSNADEDGEAEQPSMIACHLGMSARVCRDGMAQEV